MYCTKCGLEISKDEKFCKNCGQEVSQDKKNGQPVPTAARPASRACSKSCVWVLLLLLLSIYLGILFGYHDKIDSSPNLRIAFYLMGAFFVIIFIWAIFRPRKKLSHNTNDSKDTKDSEDSEVKPRKSGFGAVWRVLLQLSPLSLFK